MTVLLSKYDVTDVKDKSRTTYLVNSVITFSVEEKKHNKTNIKYILINWKVNLFMFLKRVSVWPHKWGDHSCICKPYANQCHCTFMCKSSGQQIRSLVGIYIILKFALTKKNNLFRQKIKKVKRQKILFAVCQNVLVHHKIMK